MKLFFGCLQGTSLVLFSGWRALFTSKIVGFSLKIIHKRSRDPRKCFPSAKFMVWFRFYDITWLYCFQNETVNTVTANGDTYSSMLREFCGQITWNVVPTKLCHHWLIASEVWRIDNFKMCSFNCPCPLKSCGSTSLVFCVWPLEINITCKAGTLHCLN